MLVLTAPAKINVTLEVLDRRADGYHTLRSVMLPIARYDRITLEPATVATFASSDPTLVSDNLVARALVACGVATPYRVTLEKSIPVGGGLGGGSSDAAAIVRAAMRGDLGPVGDRDWLGIAAALGSDVPFFLLGTGALVEGVGERTTALGALPTWWVVVARPRVAVATAHAYGLIDKARAGATMPSRTRSTSASLAAVDAIQRHDLAALETVLVNDFHAPVLAAYPEVAAAAEALVAAGARLPLLSGSGSCLFALFDDAPSAERVRERIDARAVEFAFAVPLHRDTAWR